MTRSSYRRKVQPDWDIAVPRVTRLPGVRLAAFTGRLHGAGRPANGPFSGCDALPRFRRRGCRRSPGRHLRAGHGRRRHRRRAAEWACSQPCVPAGSPVTDPGVRGVRRRGRPARGQGDRTRCRGVARPSACASASGRNGTGTIGLRWSSRLSSGDRRLLVGSTPRLRRCGVASPWPRGAFGSSGWPTRWAGLSSGSGPGSRAQVGMTPKRVAQLVRFDHPERTCLPGGLSAAEVAAETGYADQSHLHRDSTAFAGLTPAAVAAAPWLRVDPIAWGVRVEPSSTPSNDTDPGA